MREMEGQLEWAQNYAEVQIEVTGVLPLTVPSLHSAWHRHIVLSVPVQTGKAVYSLVQPCTAVYSIKKM